MSRRGPTPPRPDPVKRSAPCPRTGHRRTRARGAAIRPSSFQDGDDRAPAPSLRRRARFLHRKSPEAPGTPRATCVAEAA